MGDSHEIADEARRRFGLPDATVGPLEIAVLLERVLVVDADIAERATTAPAFGGSQEYGWVNGELPA